MGLVEDFAFLGFAELDFSYPFAFAEEVRSNVLDGFDKTALRSESAFAKVGLAFEEIESEVYTGFVGLDTGLGAGLDIGEADLFRETLMAEELSFE